MVEEFLHRDASFSLVSVNSLIRTKDFVLLEPRLLIREKFIFWNFFLLGSIVSKYMGRFEFVGLLVWVFIFSNFVWNLLTTWKGKKFTLTFWSPSVNIYFVVEILKDSLLSYDSRFIFPQTKAKSAKRFFLCSKWWDVKQIFIFHSTRLDWFSNMCT